MLGSESFVPFTIIGGVLRPASLLRKRNAPSWIFRSIYGHQWMATDKPMQIHLSNLVKQPNLSLASVLLAFGVFGFISSGSQELAIARTM